MLFKNINNTNENLYPIFICYYTINTLYENEIKNLIKSLKKLRYLILYMEYFLLVLGYLIQDIKQNLLVI